MPSSEALRTLRWLTRSVNGVLQQPQTVLVRVSFRIISYLEQLTDNHTARMR